MSQIRFSPVDIEADLKIIKDKNMQLELIKSTEDYEDYLKFKTSILSDKELGFNNELKIDEDSIKFKIIDTNRCIIGAAEIHIHNRNTILEINYTKSFLKTTLSHGSGGAMVNIDKELIHGLTKYCFDKLNMHNVIVKVYDSANTITQALNVIRLGSLDAVGFDNFGEEKEVIWEDGRWYSIMYYQVLEEKYYELK